MYTDVHDCDHNLTETCVCVCVTVCERFFLTMSPCLHRSSAAVVAVHVSAAVVAARGRAGAAAVVITAASAPVATMHGVVAR